MSEVRLSTERVSASSNVLLTERSADSHKPKTLTIFSSGSKALGVGFAGVSPRGV